MPTQFTPYGLGKFAGGQHAMRILANRNATEGPQVLRGVFTAFAVAVGAVMGRDKTEMMFTTIMNTYFPRQQRARPTLVVNNEPGPYAGDGNGGEAA